MAVLGGDVTGAVTVKPMDESTHGDQKLHGDDQQQKGVLRFSLVGVQLKFPAIMEASGGLTIPAHGIGGSWIVKLPSTQFPAVPENEYVIQTKYRSGSRTTARRSW